jgi:hypothetical protein
MMPRGMSSKTKGSIQNLKLQPQETKKKCKNILVMLSKHICTPVKNKAINEVLMECENA